jgi:hypothetical protein
MRSALYYPHTEIRSESLMKTALMLWDRLYVIVPFEDYKPHYGSSEAAEGFEIIGKCHTPSKLEKQQAHELVEDFATKRLPEAFSYLSVKCPEEAYEVYPQKFLPETFEILQQAGLAGNRLANDDFPLARPTGLSLMSLLADCCAGESLVRVTDRSVAYASLSGLMTDPTAASFGEADARESILALALKVADSDSIPLAKWIEFRKRENSAADGHQVRDLRHRFVEHIETQAKRIASAKSGVERTEIEMQSGEDTLDDYKALHEALKLEAWQLFPTKEIIISILGGIAAIGSLALNSVIPMPDVLTSTGAIASIGGLLASKSKYVNARRNVLRDHPLSYLYEAGGGLRL